MTNFNITIHSPDGAHLWTGPAADFIATNEGRDSLIAHVRVETDGDQPWEGSMAAFASANPDLAEEVGALPVGGRRWFGGGAALASVVTRIAVVVLAVVGVPGCAESEDEEDPGQGIVSVNPTPQVEYAECEDAFDTLMFSCGTSAWGHTWECLAGELGDGCHAAIRECADRNSELPIYSGVYETIIEHYTECWMADDRQDCMIDVCETWR